MNRRLSTMAVLLFVVPLTSVRAETPGDLRLVLLIGQSNMAGRGKVTPADQQIHPRIFMLDSACAWVPAKDPVHFDKPGMAGVGLASEFARSMAAREPQAAIGLIPCAVGGTSMAQWAPDGALYSNAVARARKAMARGKLCAILWHQGESDSGEQAVAAYPAKFAAMVTRLRADLDAEDVPLLVGELGRFRSASLPFNAMLPQLVTAVPRCAIISAEGLADKGDALHFSAEALHAFGKRYFEAFARLAEATP